ncbi:hypothetical protein [Chitinophaga ginsengisoli]|uniref:Uncharacterized protein n=1 Tax=Chitinophaga ginsengisoli TaxID=363837 RepID=A0A2P8FQZ2_9BACT|nr:hypothetical protein [Chitinophaga ginsengisoli]PSL24075.1 hypothetical protein CLV42_11661 [Chitinophaga ginsengisoli]
MAASYLPSFFEVNIPVADNLSSILEMRPEVQALYAHEYVHFLQNLTTNFGLLRTWNQFDRIVQIINYVRQSGPDIQLPLTGEVIEHEKNNRILLRCLEGSGFRAVPERNSHDYSIVAVEQRRDPLLDETFAVDYLRHIVLKLQLQDLPEVDYTFGETAIAETMAYLIESKFFQIEAPQKWPYLAGKEFAQFIYPPVAADSELLLALCDISLMHPVPGWAFFTLLTEMAASVAPPTTAEKLIDFARVSYARRGWNIDKQLESARDGVMNRIQTLFNSPFLEPTRKWFENIVYRAADLRDSHYKFILEVYRSNDLFKEGLVDMVVNLGGPHTINALGNRYIIAPHGIGITAEDIHPQKLKALDQVHDMLLMPAAIYRCKLLDICRDSEPADLVDEKCRDRPWERTRYDRLCPFSVLWNYYELDKKRFHFGQEQIYVTP